MGRNVSLREKIGEKCLLGRKVLGRNVLGRKDFWGETSEYRCRKSKVFKENECLDRNHLILLLVILLERAVVVIVFLTF